MNQPVLPAAAAVLLLAGMACASAKPLEGTRTIETRYKFAALLERVERAVEKHGLGVVAAGLEAPLRLYLTENRDGTATLGYRTPSAVFAPYRNAELDRLARELDAIFERLAKDAAGS